MSHEEKRARNKAILADSATGKYTAEQLAKKHKVSKQHIYNIRSEARKLEDDKKRRAAVKAIQQIHEERSARPAELQNALDRLAATMIDRDALRKEIIELEKVIEDLIGRNKTLLRVIDRLIAKD